MIITMRVLYLMMFGVPLAGSIHSAIAGAPPDVLVVLITGAALAVLLGSTLEQEFLGIGSKRLRDL
ncbi:MAG: hypothetical protein Q7S12_04605 [bacterium]|nr:hypothetical protein [bacterium]